MIYIEKILDIGVEGRRFFLTLEEAMEAHGRVDRNFDYFTNPLNPDTDFDGQIDSVDLIPKDYDMNGDGRINDVSLVDPDSDYYVERIAWAANHDPWLDRDTSGNLIGSYDMSGDGVLNDDPDNKDQSRDGMPTEYEEEVGVANGGWQHPYLYNARYAVLLGSGASQDKEGNHPAFWNDIKLLYDVLVDDYNYQEENVHLLYSVWRDEDHSEGCEAVDGEANRDGLECAIESVEQNMTANDFLIIALRGHGNKRGITLAPEPGHPPKWTTGISYEILGGILDTMKYARMVVLIGSCESGGAIPHIEGENRIVMTSAKDNEPSYTTLFTVETGAFFYRGRRGFLFPEYYDGLVKSLGSLDVSRSLEYAFDKGYEAAQNNYALGHDYKSAPQMSNRQLAESTYI